MTHVWQTIPLIRLSKNLRIHTTADFEFQNVKAHFRPGRSAPVKKNAPRIKNVKPSLSKETLLEKIASSKDFYLERLKRQQNRIRSFLLNERYPDLIATAHGSIYCSSIC